MKRSQRLKSVQEFSQSRERKAAEELGAQVSKVDLQQKRLEDLQRYKKEYLEQFQSSAKGGMDGAQLQRYHAFIVKIDTAIQQQEMVYAQALRELEDKREHWRGTNSRNKAIAGAVDRYKQDEEKQSDKKEQRESDDRVKARYLS